MTTQRRNFYVETPLDKLMRAFRTNEGNIDDFNLQVIGSYKKGNRDMLRFNVDDNGKKLELHPGLIWLDDVVPSVKTTQGENDDGTKWTRKYGGYAGKAHVDATDGHYTMRSSIPALVIPDRKMNAGQRNAFTQAVHGICSKHKNVAYLEVNPTSVTLFESREKDSQGIPAFRLLVIEAAGFFGQDSRGRSIYCSIRQSPVVASDSSQDEEEAQPAPRSRARTSSAPAPASNDGMEAEVGGELVTA